MSLSKDSSAVLAGKPVWLRMLWDIDKLKERTEATSHRILGHIREETERWVKSTNSIHQGGFTLVQIIMAATSMAAVSPVQLVKHVYSGMGEHGRKHPTRVARSCPELLPCPVVALQSRLAATTYQPSCVNAGADTREGGACMRSGIGMASAALPALLPVRQEHCCCQHQYTCLPSARFTSIQLHFLCRPCTTTTDSFVHWPPQRLLSDFLSACVGPQ